jgi:hypothetical protein
VNHRGDRFSRSNPFSTRFTRPGAIPYWFGTPECAAGLARKLAASGLRGQIVGPHGTGKSTLIAALREQLEQQGRPSWLTCLHDGQRRLPPGWKRAAERVSAQWIIIDGYEQLAPSSRVWLRIGCRCRGWGLLVATHHDAGFPTLWRTTADPRAAQAVVEHLLSEGDTPISRQVVAERYAQARGDMRKMLFALYDQYETMDGSTKPS